MAYALAVGSLSFLFAWLGGYPLLRFLQGFRIGKRIRADGPESHVLKEGTPTMGGLLIFLSVFIVTVPLNLIDRLSIVLPLFVMVSTGILGAVDDLMNLTGRLRSGMSTRVKFLGLLAISSVAAYTLFFLFEARSINIPCVGKFDIGLWYLPIAVLVILGSANAVNLTDGLDTLAGGTAALAFAAFGIIAFLQEQSFLATFSYTVVGAILGFLWFNAYPAQLFMGDTGSLALGATFAVVGFMTGWWLLLPVIGIVFVLEAGSVILQVAYFRATGGKRLFKMSPLHHHFELIGWSETQITTRFWLLGILATMLGVALALC